MNWLFVFEPREKLTNRWRPSLAEVIFVASGREITSPAEAWDIFSNKLKFLIIDIVFVSTQRQTSGVREGKQNGRQKR